MGQSIKETCRTRAEFVNRISAIGGQSPNIFHIIYYLQPRVCLLLVRKGPICGVQREQYSECGPRANKGCSPPFRVITSCARDLKANRNKFPGFVKQQQLRNANRNKLYPRRVVMIFIASLVVAPMIRKTLCCANPRSFSGIYIRIRLVWLFFVYLYYSQTKLSSFT